MSDSTSIIIKNPRFFKILSVFGTLLFGWIFFLCILNKESFGIAALFLLFAALGILLWFLADSYLEINDQKILASEFYGRFEIRWDEIIAVAINPYVICFSGGDKRVVISIPWPDKKSKQALDLINDQCKKRNIRIDKPFFVPFTHHNSRIS